MQQKNTFMLLTLSYSLLMMIMGSVLFFIPGAKSATTNTLQNNQYTLSNITSPVFFSAREPEEIKADIEAAIRANRPDDAKKLYDELQRIYRYQAIMEENKIVANVQ